MTSIDIITNVGITSYPIEVYVCNVYGTFCVWVAQITTISPPTITIVLPFAFDTAPSVTIKLVGNDGCTLSKEILCDSIATPTPTPVTPTPTPSITLTPTATPTPTGIGCECLKWTNWNSSSNGSINLGGGTIDLDVFGTNDGLALVFKPSRLLCCNNFYTGGTVWPTTYKLNTTGIRTFTFSQSVVNPILAVYSLGSDNGCSGPCTNCFSPDSPATISANTPYQEYCYDVINHPCSGIGLSYAITPLDSFSFSGRESYGMVQFIGTFTEIKLDYLITEGYTSINWGLPCTSNTIPLTPTPTVTQTATQTPTVTQTSSQTPTQTPTVTQTSSQTPTVTPTPTSTPPPKLIRWSIRGDNSIINSAGSRSTNVNLTLSGNTIGDVVNLKADFITPVYLTGSTFVQGTQMNESTITTLLFSVTMTAVTVPVNIVMNSSGSSTEIGFKGVDIVITSTTQNANIVGSTPNGYRYLTFVPSVGVTKVGNVAFGSNSLESTSGLSCSNYSQDRLYSFTGTSLAFQTAGYISDLQIGDIIFDDYDNNFVLIGGNNWLTLKNCGNQLVSQIKRSFLVDNNGVIQSIVLCP